MTRMAPADRCGNSRFAFRPRDVSHRDAVDDAERLGKVVSSGEATDD